MPPNVVRLPSNITAAGADALSAVSSQAILPKIKLGGAADVVRRDTAEALPNVPQPVKIVLGGKKAQSKLSKEQKSGMSLQDLKVCQNLLQKLVSTKKADLFRRPVDPIRDGAPS